MTLDELIVDRLHSNGFEVFIVGGAVRDWLLGIDSLDVDYTTNARPEQLAKIFSDKKVTFSGESFGVTRVSGVEIATYRKDVKYKVRFKASSCEPEYADTLKEDLERRDLTINAMAIEPITGKLIDLHGGLQDLEDGIIRFVGDPRQRLEEDLGRLIRAIRFFASCGTEFDYDSLAAMFEYAQYVDEHVKKERIHDELVKALSTRTPSVFFSLLLQLGLLENIFPALADCYDHTGGHYHQETVWEHCMLAGDNIHPKFPMLRLAGYLHDMGKPASYDPDEDNFLNHEQIGATFAKAYLRRLKFSKNRTRKIVSLIRSHMRICATLTPRGVRRLAKHFGDNHIDPRDFLRLKIADRLANLKNGPTDITKTKNMVRKCGIRGMEPVPMTVNDLGIKGGQLITALNLTPGPIVSTLQKALLEHTVNSTDPNVNEYENLLQKAKELLEGGL